MLTNTQYCRGFRLQQINQQESKQKMTCQEIEKIIKNHLRMLAGQSYNIFSGPMPLGAKSGLSLTLKSADIGNSVSNCMAFTITLRSGDRDALIDNATTLRNTFNHSLPEGVICEVPEQDFFVEGVKGAFRWVWESSFDIKATAVNTTN